jgi:glycosyltransferase involved in cell wall biosynthesis
VKIDWIESKLIDVSTNHLSRTEMCRHLHNMGHQIRYYCGYKYSKRRFPNLPEEIIRYISAPSIPKVRAIFFWTRIAFIVAYKIIIEKPDILMIDYYINLMTAPVLLAARYINGKTKIVLDIRTLPSVPRSFKRDIKVFWLSLRMAKKNCDAMSFITAAMKEYCSRVISIDDQNTVVWSSGFDEGLFDPSRYVIKKGNRFELFYHGEVALSRGIGNLIVALKILRDKGYDMGLIIIGTLEADGEEIRELITRNHLSDYCHILRPVFYEKIPQMIAECDLPVIPLPKFIAWEVSSPLKLIEYMAMGKAIVLTDIRAHRDVVKGEPFAFFATSSDAQMLASAIETAYLAKEQLKHLGQRARAVALENYTWRSQASALGAFFNMIHE